jgi:hypothetical protein
MFSPQYKVRHSSLCPIFIITNWAKFDINHANLLSSLSPLFIGRAIDSGTAPIYFLLTPPGQELLRLRQYSIKTPHESMGGSSEG